MPQQRDPRINYFGKGVEARYYSESRPKNHAAILEVFKKFTAFESRLTRALDVGCGTGLSSVALRDLAQVVVGVDPSYDMLRQADRRSDIAYLQATAEQIPLSDATFDLVTASHAFHWFDQARFLAEVQRLLCPHGWLVVYYSWFKRELKNVPQFRIWCEGDFIKRFPQPGRGSPTVSKELAAEYGLTLHHEDEITEEIEMSDQRFAEYQASTSNIIAVVKSGGCSYEEAIDWIRRSVATFTGEKGRGTYLFGGRIWILRKR